MADFTLTAEPPLAGTDMVIAGVRLWAPADLAVVSIALPLGPRGGGGNAIEAAYGVALPEIGKSSSPRRTRGLIRLAPIWPSRCSPMPRRMPNVWSRRG